MPNTENTARELPWRAELRKSIKASERTKIKRVVMPALDAAFRSTNHLEVNSGLTAEMAMNEAKRCLDCAIPTCIEGCPVNIEIPAFIKHIEKGDFLEAAAKLKETSSLPAVCGRVCPQEVQCEAKCFYTQKLGKPAVAIGNLERFAADFERQEGKANIPEIKEKKNIKVAVVGSGPAGLAAAYDLARYGYQVTVFEALHDTGGVLRYGIPQFRLPKEIVDFEINNLKKLGVEFRLNFLVGKTVLFEDLRQMGYKAFFISSGAGLPNFMNIPGENLVGVFSSNEYLTRVNLMKAGQVGYDTPVFSGKRVAVIGGGNTAMDSVRTAKRLGAEQAMIIYRRSMDEIPARAEEVHHAIEEGVEFMCLNNPVEYHGNERGRVTHIKLQKMELGEPDEKGRRKPNAVKGSEYTIEADCVIASIGVSPNPLVPKSLSGLEMSKYGTIKVNPNTMQTAIPDVFAGGDIVRGGATVILAMGDGRKAAAGIDKYLNN